MAPEGGGAVGSVSRGVHEHVCPHRSWNLDTLVQMDYAKGRVTWNCTKLFQKGQQENIVIY